ncbi:MAG: Na+/H+ antiporter NhaA [Chitinophagaceae bacterium]
MKLTKLFTEFFDSEKAAGFILIGCTVVSLLIANSALSEHYLGFWHAQLGGHSIEYWINDGLMVIFFLLIGLELEREVYIGELSDIKSALLPVFAAAGGMLIPAGIYLLFNYGTPEQPGAGIPMATDIAFAIGMLSLLGRRVPVALKVFLTALAVIDDLGAILVIAFFYSKGLIVANLLIALGIFGVLLILNRLRVHILWIYLVAGVIMWYFMLNSGVHPTITGVLLAFAIPFGTGGSKTISYKLQHFLHKPVSFIILPIFALANTGIVIEAGWADDLLSNGSLGIFFGLLAGKPLGILLFSLLAVLLGLASLPAGVKWKHIGAVGLLAGIGFTMAIFITLLAFDDQTHITNAKIAILLASLVAAVSGLLILNFSLRRKLKAILPQ